MKKIILVCGLWISTVYAFAQNNTAQIAEANQAVSSEDKQIVDVTQKFFTALEVFTNNKEVVIEPITKLLDKDFISTRYIISVDGKQTRSEVKLDAYRNQLVAFKSIQGFSSTYKVEKINFVRAYETFATINFSVLITASINDEVVLKFRSLVTNYLRKSETGEWKIVESNGVNVYKDQVVGICPLAISQKGNNVNEYGVTILSPAGTNFKTDNLVFNFKQADTKTLIMMNENVYKLDNNELTCIKENSKVVSIPLGKSSNPIESINLILSKQLYTNKCLGFKNIGK